LSVESNEAINLEGQKEETLMNLDKLSKQKESGISEGSKKNQNARDFIKG